MENIDDCYRNGSPSHLGTCPECGQYNGDCYNGLCSYCVQIQPILCPQCNTLVDCADMTSHGICDVCLDENAEKFTRKFLHLTK